jgi:release factor glutamine methyltransferase
MRVREALAAAARRLSGTSETPRLDAELLMAEALGASREELLLRHLDAPMPPSFEELLERRALGEPIAYITGRRAFWTIELDVGPGVLIPRPESETLIEAAVKRFGSRSPRRVLDLGTGPGTLLLAALAEWPAATGLAVDRSAEALSYAERNAERLGLRGRAEFRSGDWGQGLDERFDLILCNPPYVQAGADLPPSVARYEPAEALYAGADGLDDYRRLAPQIARLLAPVGVACVEIGAGQDHAVAALFRAAGLQASTRPDLAGIPRCLLVTH